MTAAVSQRQFSADRVMNLHKKCIHSKLRSKLAFQKVYHVVDERVAHGSFHRGSSPQIGRTPLITVYKIAVCCGVLRCVAVCCSVLQCVAVCCSDSVYSVAVCCSVLQCVAVCCSDCV